MLAGLLQARAIKGLHFARHKVGVVMTPRQKEVLATFAALTVSLGPTLRALSDALGIKSHNATVEHLVALEKAGLVQRWARGKSRSFVLTEKGRKALNGK